MIKRNTDFITQGLLDLKKETRYYPPRVVFTGGWNIPGTISWLKLKGQGHKGHKSIKELEEIGFRIKSDAQKVTENVINLGWGVVVGGALGVDHFVTQKVYDMGKLEQLLVMLPVRLNDHLTHFTDIYFDKTKDYLLRGQIDEVNSLLWKISRKSKVSIHESRFKRSDEKSYYQRNSREVFMGDYLCAFHIDESDGTKDTIEKALSKDRFVYIHRYEVLQEVWTKKYDRHVYNEEKSGLSPEEIDKIFGLSRKKVSTLFALDKP